MGVPSATLIGRPIDVMFSVVGATPSDWAKVARMSPTSTLPLATDMPSAVVLPYACPPRIPPPAKTHDQAPGKWSRPALPLILGVRPNSPNHNTVVDSSKPR